MTRYDVRSAKGGQWVKADRGTAVAPIDPGTGTTTTLTPHLPIDFPDRSTFLAGHYVGGHEFVPFPRNGSDGFPDYINKFWPPGQVEFAGQTNEVDHRVYGGWIRQRSYYRTAASGLTDEAWRTADFKTEVQWAAAANWDFVTLNLMQPIGVQLGNYAMWYVNAFKSVNPANLKIWLMPDASVSFCRGRSPEAAAADCVTLIKISPTHFGQINGKYVVAPFGPEITADYTPVLAYWTAFKAEMARLGYPCYFWPCYARTWTATNAAPTLDSIADGHGRWGPGDPDASNAATGEILTAHNTYDKPWLTYARAQDNRAKSGVFWESKGAELMRVNFTNAKTFLADAIQIQTVNDWGENSGVGPSTRSGFAWLDYMQYWLAWYKTGTAPTIARNAVFLCHRTQFLSVDTTADVQSTLQTKFMVKTGSTTAVDEIDVTTFVTGGDAQLHVYADGVQIGATVTVSNGVTATKKPLTAGVITAELRRSGAVLSGTSVTGREPVISATATGTARPLVQDRTYLLASSLSSRAA